MRCYAFDVDETLEVSAGPIPLHMVWALRESGEIVGLCGNWAMVTLRVAGWHMLFSFLGPMNLPKVDFLRQIKMYVPASEYVMVGNDPAIKGQSQDAQAAQESGWRFIREDDFAAGQR